MYVGVYRNFGLKYKFNNYNKAEIFSFFMQQLQFL